MTGKEALKEYRNQQTGVNVYADEYLDIVEKDLEVLEIIKSRKVDIHLLKNATYGRYNHTVKTNKNNAEACEYEYLSKREFNLIKEWLARWKKWQVKKH